MTDIAPNLEFLLGGDWRTRAESRRNEILERVGDRRDVLLFGAGDLGRLAVRDLAGSGFLPRAFVDNNPARWGSTIDDLEVLPPYEAARRFDTGTLWLITVYTNRAVIAQCAELGVPWITCAELSWLLPEPHSPGFDFGHPDALASCAAEIERAAGLWADPESAAEYAAQIRWRFLLDYGGLTPPRPMSELYFPDDLVRSLDDEVFVDLGAFTGNTVEDFLARRGHRWSRIVAVEPDRRHCATLRDSFPTWGGDPARIRIEAVAVGAIRGILPFEASGTVSSRTGTGASDVEVVPLDELLEHEAPTYLKFDVEGAEHDALVGGARTIGARLPVLAVCLYHKPEDVWDLPLLVHSIAPGYRLHLRRYSEERWETVLYAIPPDRDLTSTSDRPGRS